jgi:hypothetical protein
MRIQSRNSYDDGLDGLDPYFTCLEAIASLIVLEGDRLPHCLWEPAAGDGAIVRPLRQTGRIVIASDIHDYGLPGCGIYDYLTAAPPPGIEGIVTNPPYKGARQFAEKAISEVGYVALLVRSNFDVEGVARMRFRALHPPTRIWRSARRLPMMHRYGWNGPRAPSNTPHCWLIWERGAPRRFPQDFDWRAVLAQAGEILSLQDILPLDPSAARRAPLPEQEPRQAALPFADPEGLEKDRAAHIASRRTVKGEKRQPTYGAVSSPRNASRNARTGTSHHERP